VDAIEKTERTENPADVRARLFRRITQTPSPSGPELRAKAPLMPPEAEPEPEWGWRDLSNALTRVAGRLFGKSRLARLASATRGSVTTMLAVSAVPLIAAIGLGTDSGLAFMVKAKMQHSLDAAGLAAGRVIFSENVEADAQAFFEANFPAHYLDATVTDFTVTMDAGKEFVTLTAEASSPTRFMSMFGFDEMTVASRTVIQRENRGMELALVMDNTGSMRSGGKITAMKDAAHLLVDTIYGEETSLPDVWISLVPYTAAVNAGAQHGDWLAFDDRIHDLPSPYQPTEWLGCVEARTAPLDQDDTPPGDAPFTSYFYAAEVDNEWVPVNESNGAQNNGTGPNLGCGPAITPLVSERATVDAAITEMLPWHRGGTTSNLGLVWGWRTLSPRWRGLWDGAEPDVLPLGYDEPLIDKVVVILTDGQNQFFDFKGHDPNNGVGPGGSDYTAYGRLADFGFASLNAAREEIDLRFAAICTAMKAESIEIFAITFGSTPNASTQELYRACATTPSNYFHSPDNATLEDAFRSIGQVLSNLRIAE
jgi:Flp pilus assembly protein TadG